MKKLLCTIALIFSQCSLADGFFYCPSLVVCSTEKDSSSCKIDHEIWGTATFGGKVQSGNYRLVHVWTTYEADDRNVYTRCMYENRDSGVQKTIWFDAKDKFQAFVQDHTKWVVNGFDAQCRDIDNTKDCPLIPLSVS